MVDLDTCAFCLFIRPATKGLVQPRPLALCHASQFVIPVMIAPGILPSRFTLRASIRSAAQANC